MKVRRIFLLVVYSLSDTVIVITVMIIINNIKNNIVTINFKSYCFLTFCHPQSMYNTDCMYIAFLETDTHVR